MNTPTTPPHAPLPEHRAWLADFQTSTRADHSALQSVERAWSWARLCCFSAGVAVWFIMPGGWLQTCMVAAGLVIAFALAVRRHRSARMLRELSDRLLEMIDESTRRSGGRVTLIRDHRRPELSPDIRDAIPATLADGPTWTLQPQEHDDLDLYAEPVGVFGLLNRTATPLGARRLRHMLEHPCLSIEHIRARQECVRWLHDHRAERMRMMAAQSALRPHDRRVLRLVRALTSVTLTNLPGRAGLLRLWSVPSLIVAVVSLPLMGMGHVASLYALIGLVLWNGALYCAMRKKLNAALAPWKGLNTCADGYVQASRQAARDLPGETGLATLRTHFADVVADDALPSLCRRMLWADSGGAFHLMCNVIFFYDLHVAWAIVGRASAVQNKLLGGLAALAELESLCSLACFADESAAPAHYATFDANPMLKIVGGRHPLLDGDRAVSNDVELGAATAMWLITGSNMSGKSTLLRMTAVSVLLAQMGTASPADRVRMTPLRLITDLQVRDNLAEHESYFLAEVRHLRRMVLPPDGGAPVLGLMDEPFRGTNSEEQVAASVAVAEHLLTTSGLFLIATHERALTCLAERYPRVQNRHFQEEIESTGMVFDYRLRSGPAATRNALLVLEREGYPEQLMRRARDILRHVGADDDGANQTG